TPHLSPYFSFICPLDPPDLHSFPTRRSSDLGAQAAAFQTPRQKHYLSVHGRRALAVRTVRLQAEIGRVEWPANQLDQFRLVIERSEEHTSELQSPYDLVCRLLLEKKKKKK